jgi:hypothetical protein
MNGPNAKMPLAKLWLIPQDGRVQVMAFDAIAHNDKQFVIGEGIGKFGPSGMILTEIGQLVLERICAHSDVEQDQVWLVEIANERRIERRLRQTFEKAPSGSVIMLICHTPALIDGLLPFFDLRNERFTA